MKKQVPLLCALALFFAVGCGSDKNSNEACLYETTMNLDKGNYDAVLASTCADSMQKGAAYFGKAGYSAKDVINRFSETSNSASTTSDLTTYMNTLTGKVTEDTLTNMDNAKTEYNTIPSTSTYYKDAKFYVSLVDAVKSLSLIKIVTDSTGLGTLSSCDINSNTVPDDADASSCALLVSAGQSCTTAKATYIATGDIAITDQTTGASKAGTYKGLTITATGTATSSCTGVYKKLLYKDSANLLYGYSVATTSTNMCTGSDGNTWPCPIVQNGQPLDLVTAIDQTITSAISSMGQALPAGTSADVQQSITDIKKDACGADQICTSADVAAYLQTL